MTYTTNNDNEDSSEKKTTPEKCIETMGVPGTETLPLENDELIIPVNNIENASNHSTEFSEYGGDGLLVGFGGRPKVVHVEDSSISSSDSSTSDSGNCGSSGSGSSGSESSGSESSGSESSSRESSTNSEESPRFAES